MKAYPTSPEQVDRNMKPMKRAAKTNLTHYWSQETGALCGKVLDYNLLLDSTLSTETATCKACQKKAGR